MKEKAKAFATKAHDGQFRKSDHEPYIMHPIRVAERLEAAGLPDELVAAAYLHDVVEDTSVTIEEIQQTFGNEVATLVAAHTEDKSKSWQERKQHTINTVKTASKHVRYLIVADKLDNLQSVENGLHIKGDKLWEEFNAGYECQKWYNASIARNMYEGLSTKDIPEYFSTFEEMVEDVFGENAILHTDE